MLQKLPVNNFEQIEETSQFNEDFIKNYNDESDMDIFLKLMFNTQKNMNFIMTSVFTRKKNFKKLKGWLRIYMIKMNMLCTKKFKTGIKSRISFGKSSQSD